MRVCISVRSSLAVGSLSAIMIAVLNGVAMAQVIAPVQSRVTLPRCSKEGQKIVVKIMTGVSAANTSLPPGTVDSNWAVIGPSVGPNTYATNKIAPWLTPVPPAMWIQPSKTGNPDASLPAGLYRYRLLFNTPADPYLYASFSITGSIAADNTITAIKLDNQPFFPLPNCTNCFGAASIVNFGPVSPTLVNSNSPHVLEIDVNNAGIYSGLYVNLTATAVCSKCTLPRPPFHKISTLTRPSRQLSLLERKSTPHC